jgi:hypothetical protein
MFDDRSWAPRYDDAAQRLLADERVLAAVQVGRTGGWATMALGAVSGGAALMSMSRAKKRGGGLPQMWLLAVTEEHVHALALPKMSSGLRPRAVRELARWSRDEIVVETEPVTLGTKLTLTVAATGERVECQGPEGELTDRVARLLTGSRLATGAVR